MTDYMVVLVGEPENWTSKSAEEKEVAYAEFNRFDEELARRGHTIVGGAELHDPSGARTVHPGGHKVTDGPYTETAEQIGGYFQVQSDDVDDLIECCRILAALGDAVEVRRCVDPEEREL